MENLNFSTSVVEQIGHCGASATACQDIPVGISNRHIHLSQEDLEVLFGEGYALTEMKALKQPGQFAATETVCIAGPRGSITNVRVLGPVRKSSQVELSKTDGFALGVNAPIRESGVLENSGNICVIGPKGSVNMEHKAIVAKRHIHMTPQDATALHVTNGQVVSIVTDGERSLTFGNVVVRVDPNYSLECHVDTDEANAAGFGPKSTVRIQG